MSIIQRRNSQRLASTLDALSADLDFQAKEVDVEVDENVATGSATPDEYWEGKAKGDQAIQLLGQETQTVEESAEQDFDKAFACAMAEIEEQAEQQQKPQNESTQASILQGDPGVEEVGSQSTFDSDDVRELGKDHGIDFDGDQDLEDSIRNVPGRNEKQARIKKLIARIERVADAFESSGRKSLAYRLDIICNNLEANYLNK